MIKYTISIPGNNTQKIIIIQVRKNFLVDDLFAMYELRGYELGENISVDKVINEIV